MTIEIIYMAGYYRQFYGWQRYEYGCLEDGLSVSLTLFVHHLKPAVGNLAMR